MPGLCPRGCRSPPRYPRVHAQGRCDLRLAHPIALALFIAIPVIAWILIRARRSSTAPLPSTSALSQTPRTWRIAFRWIPGTLRLAVLGLLITSLARPQESSGWSTTSTDGIAIQIVFDRSGSMREPMGGDNGDVPKLEVAKNTVAAFVGGDGKSLKGRPGDMVGLIAFARYSDTLAPLARTHDALLQSVKRIQPALVRGEDGTGIGDALALGAARLKRAEEDLSRQAKPENRKPDFSIRSKVIILMTDGQNNCGDVSPYDAAEQAKQWGVRIYTIGVGAGGRFMTMDTPFGKQQVPIGNDVDERMLRDIATSTGGAYFSASNPGALAEAYKEIDRLETSKIDATEHTAYKERFTPLGIAAALLLALEFFLAGTAFRRMA